LPQTGRCSGAEAVPVAVPGGLVAYVLGAVTGIESKAVIDGTSLSGATSQDRFAFSSAHQGARRSQGAEIRELAGRADLSLNPPTK
jgi:3-keto-L-gulonate-6-phosphate decarboxylase